MAGMSAPAPEMVAIGSVGKASRAATEMAEVAEAGAPVMYGTEDELPAEATTTTPEATSASVAVESGESPEPKDEPSDMFTTSMPSACETLYAATHSRASTTRLVVPWQPNTL